MRRRSSFYSLLSAAALLVAVQVPVLASDTETAPGEATDGNKTLSSPTAGRSGGDILGAAPEPSTETIEQIREEREALITGTHFTYDPAGRRDPFRSLLEIVSIKGDRPDGIQGMMISEVDLVGIVESPRGEIAFVHGSDNRGYFLRKGDRLYDGTIVSIDRSGGEVIFRQRVEDPREIKPFRDVIKKLYSSTEEGR